MYHYLGFYEYIIMKFNKEESDLILTTLKHVFPSLVHMFVLPMKNMVKVEYIYIQYDI